VNTMTDQVVPFRARLDDADIADLRERLRRTRWAERATVSDASQGVPLAYLQDLCRYWSEAFDFAGFEQRLDEHPQYRTVVDDVPIHFVHSRSPHPGALPIVLTHGWPGSYLEFRRVVGPLVDPALDGGDPADAFDVVCPSLPGYGFSGKPVVDGWGVERIASAWEQLMARLGYGRYGAQGGDWGAMVTTAMGQHHNPALVGIHLNMPYVQVDPSSFGELTPSEVAAIAARAEHDKWRRGYLHQQSTRPQTLGYGLVDSPTAQAAWIVEKFWEWTDSDNDPEAALSRDDLLDNISLYWFTATGASSARLYWESARRPNFDIVPAPTGCSIFPRELSRPSRRWVESRFTDLRFWNDDIDRGGHFAAFEEPDLFVRELRDFFRLVR
jgi:epoxide hydrolase